MKNLFFLAILAISFVACNSNPANDGPTEEQQAETAAYQEVMTMHDNMMSEMGSLRDMGQQLGGMKATVSEEGKATLEETVAILNQAQEAMMTWMQGLGAADPSALQETKTHEEIMEMMEEQKQNASAMQELFNNAKAKATSTLASLQAPAEQ